MIVTICWIAGLIITACVFYNSGKGECRHIWRTHDKQEIRQHISYDGHHVCQEIETMICENCGKIIRLNLTSGETETLINGGATYIEKKNKLEV